MNNLNQEEIVVDNVHFISPNNRIFKLNSSVSPISKGYISQYTPLRVYGLFVIEINEVIITSMIVKMI